MEEIFKLIAAFGIGTFLSGFLSFLSNNKNNLVDFEVENYQNRRKEILRISNDLSSYDIKKTEQAIEKLRMVLSPEDSSLLDNNQKDIDNIGKEYYLKDAHIWKLINNFNYSLDSNKLLRKYLRLLLEYEESIVKRKLNWNITLFFSLLCKAIPIILAIYLAVAIDTNQIAGIFYLIGIMFIAISEIMIYIFNLVDNPSNKVIKTLFNVFYTLPMIFIIFRFIFWKTNLFLSFGMQMVAAFIILILWFYSYITTFSRIDSNAQSYINKIKKLKENTHV